MSARAAAAAALYVAPDGNDQNAGTLAQPFKTIAFAVSKAHPGQSIYLRGGVYNQAPILTGSGLAGHPITLANFQAEKPIIDPGFASQYGLRLQGCGYVTIRGLEIRNLKDAPADTHNMGAIVLSRSRSGEAPHHCIIEGNTIHHIIGGRKAARGILAEAGDHLIIQNNTIYDIVGHPESMGIYASSSTDTLIRRNLVYLCDKEGIRLITYKTDTSSLIEGNIALSCHFGIDLNSCWTPRTTTLSDNFCGWNWSVGSMPKHTDNAVVAHNTFYANQHAGLDIHGGNEGNNDRPVVKNNLFSHNYSGFWLLDEEITQEQVDYNFYDQPNSILGLWNWGAAEQPRTLGQLRKMSGARRTLHGPYDLHGKEGDPLFVNPAAGDFRLQQKSPAAGSADDGQDMGARAEILTGVGADQSYGLGHIPDLGELKLRVESFSSEKKITDTATPFRPLTTGLAADATDGAELTYWQVDLASDPARELVLRLPGNQPLTLTYLTLTKYHGADDYFYKDFELFVDDGSGHWAALPQPPEHPFTGYRGNNNGETWRLPPHTRARRLKLHLLSGYGKTIRLPEIRLYALPPLPAPKP
jgi:hypothetical protein